MGKLTQEEANRQISDKLEKAHKLIKEAETIADDAGVSFSFSLGYGMGGWFNPQRPDAEESMMLQQKLFDAGYTWTTEPKSFHALDQKYLYVEKIAQIFIDSDVPEFSFEVKYSIEFTEIERETIVIDGKTYDKNTVLKLVRNLEEV